jgi:hypothetical protein
MEDSTASAAHGCRLETCHWDPCHIEQEGGVLDGFEAITIGTGEIEIFLRCGGYASGTVAILIVLYRLPRGPAAVGVRSLGRAHG